LHQCWQQEDRAIDPAQPPEDDGRKSDAIARVLVIGIVGLVMAYFSRATNPNDAPRKQSDPTQQKKRPRCDPIVIATIFIAMGAIISAGVGVLQWRTLTNQVNEMRVEQRAWVYTEAVPDTSIVHQADGFLIAVRFILHNTGHLPAIYAWPVTDGFILGDPNDVLARQRKVCEKRRHVKRSASLAGTTVFPGQVANINKGVSISQADWDKAVAAKRQAGVVPVIVGCVDYQIPGDSDRHQSYFAYILTQKFAPGLIPADPTNIPAGQLSFDAWIEGGSFAAD
jgi:hypothetical protein